MLVEETRSILLAATLCYLFATIFLSVSSKRRLKFLKARPENLKKEEVGELKKFIFPLSAMALSGVFFGYIDTLMLGHYVSSSFIAYYGAAFALISSASAIIGFTSVALIPILSRLKGKALENIFMKTQIFTIIISVMAGIFTYFISHLVILLIYGKEYLLAGPILQALSILLIVLPIAALYDTYLISQKRTGVVASLLIVSTILNVGFNFIGITYGLANYGEMGGVFGAVIATILSRVLYLAGLIFWRKNN